MDGYTVPLRIRFGNWKNCNLADTADNIRGSLEGYAGGVRLVPNSFTVGLCAQLPGFRENYCGLLHLLYLEIHKTIIYHGNLKLYCK